MPLFRITLKFERHIVVILCTNLCYFKLYCTICSVLRIICGREREHSFFCMRFLLGKENGKSCILCCIPGGFFKKFSTPHVIHCKKKCVVCPSPVRMSSTPWIITLFLDQGVLDILAKGRENRTFFLQCISLLRVFYYLGSVVVKFEQGIVVILCTRFSSLFLISLL
jgi:hypothetical protein